MDHLKKADKRKASQISSKIAALIHHELSGKGSPVRRCVASFLKNAGVLIDLVERSGLSLSNVHSERELEFYCDVSKGKRDLGYISKGWTDPGVRVGDLIYFSDSAIPKFRANIEQIVNACTSQGVAFFVRPCDSGGLEVELWTPVYGDLNGTGNLREALKSLQACRKKIGKLCPFSGKAPDGKRPHRSNGHEA